MALAIPLLLGVGSAEAQVLCKSPNGYLLLLAACGPGMTPITAGQISVQGPATGTAGPRGIRGLPGPTGPAGPPGPPGVGVTASFAFSGHFAAPGNGTVFYKLLEKQLTEGSYVIIATAAGVGLANPAIPGPVVNNCLLRNQNGEAIGAGRASGEVSDFAQDTNEITVTGGIFVPDGTTNAVSMWCNAEFDRPLEVANTQMLVMKIGGFTQ